MKNYAFILGYASWMMVALGLLHPSIVQAQVFVPLPAATYGAKATAGGLTSSPDVLVFGTTTYGGNAFVTNDAEITVSLTAAASGSSSGIVNGQGTGYGPGAVSAATAETYWELEAYNPVTGKPVTLTTPVYVPMNISGLIQTSIMQLSGSAADQFGSTVNANGQISWTYTNSQGAQSGLSYGNDSEQNGIPSSGFGSPGFLPLDQNFMAQANVLNILEVLVGGESEGDYAQNSTSYSASVDPIITINPTWLAENPGYRVVYSAGVVPAPVPVTAPEPGTLSLLGLGLAGIGFMRRRKRKLTAMRN
jgi:hypothetical protein